MAKGNYYRKNIFLFVGVFIFISFMLLEASAQQQKQSGRRQTNAGWEEVGLGSATGGGISNNTGRSAWPSIETDMEDNVYVAWNDDSGWAEQIYVKRFTGSQWEDVGTNSAALGGISNTNGKSVAPALSRTLLGAMDIGWRDWSSGFTETYFKRWIGDEWFEVLGSGSNGGVSNQMGWSPSFPSVANPNAFRSGFIPTFVVWNESDGHDQEIYIAWPEPFGTQFVVTQYSDNNGDSWNPSVAAVHSNAAAMVAWHDHSLDANAAEIYVTGHDTGGGISNNPGNSSSPSLAANTYPNYYIAWQDNTNGNSEVYVKHLVGSEWVELGVGSATDGGISNNNGESLQPRIALDANDTPYVAWYDNSSGNYEIYVRRWNGQIWEEVGVGSATGSGISENFGVSGFLDMTIDSSGNPYIAWDDNSNGNEEIYVRRFMGQTQPTPTPTASTTPTSTITPTPSPQVTNTPTATPDGQRYTYFPLVQH